MSKELSPDFIRLMHQHYDAETAQLLCSSLSATEPEVSVRLNPYKWNPQWQLSVPHESVPWCPGAYYLQQRPAFTFDPLFHAGAYYVQEASSMYIASLLQQHFAVQDRVVALDLCAAPGGKSTLLAGMLPHGSLLISNEPMPKRAQVLAENMTKWTQMPQGEHYPVTSVVTQHYPGEFAALEGCVDLLVTDVPCSGEGMFRKDDGAIQDWSLDNVDLCWHRQRDILQDIWHVLKPGGLLLYSTCTFNRFEDEDNARWICQQLGAELLEERHFLPGRDRGEGFYVAAIRKAGTPIPDYVEPRLRTLRVLYNSAQASPLEGPHIQLTYQDALSYLRREALRVEAPRGPVVLCYQGLVLGLGKGVGNRINNLYPEAWRIRTTYTTPFTLTGDL